MASHYSASQWRTWIDESQQSDLTVGKFCESIGVSVNTYYRWRQRLKNQSAIDMQPAVEFVPVALPAGQVEIELPGGARVHLDNDTNTLRPLVSLLLELGAEQ